MADYASLYPEFQKSDTEVAAISVDPPDRSAALRKDLKIQFPILSDSSRSVITQWGLLNRREGDIAIPASFVIDRERVVRFKEVEEMMMRIPPRAMLEFVRASASESAPQPRRRGVNPAAMFLRAAANGFRFGRRVKRV